MKYGIIEDSAHGGGLNEVWREAHDPRELRAIEEEPEILTRFCGKQLTIKNSKSWFAQKIAALLGELKLPEYPQGPANIPATTPS